MLSEAPPKLFRLEFVDSTQDTPTVHYVKSFEEVKRLAKEGHIFKSFSMYDGPPAGSVMLEAVTTAPERAAFARFCEICEDHEADGHDVPKEMMKRLTCIGLVRHVGFGRHETTAFGDAVRALETIPHDR
jgi:hypothetical protein